MRTSEGTTVDGLASLPASLLSLGSDTLAFRALESNDEDLRRTGHQTHAKLSSRPDLDGGGGTVGTGTVYGRRVVSGADISAHSVSCRVSASLRR